MIKHLKNYLFIILIILIKRKVNERSTIQYGTNSSNIFQFLNLSYWLYYYEFLKFDFGLIINDPKNI